MRLIGIGGVSCAGKSTITKALKQEIPNVKIIHFDSYYIDTKNLPDKTISWESPLHYDYPKFLSDLEIFESSEEADLAIVEGFLIFYDETARNLFDLKLFLDLSEDEIIKRRLARNRGTESDTLEYVQNELLRGHREFVYPQKEFADFILDGLEPTDVTVSKILSTIAKSAAK